MNTTQTEINEAIALAKAVRQTALANAKVALEEQFNENYKALFANKLKEDAGMATKPMGVADEDINEKDIDELIKELETDVDGAAGASGAPEAGMGSADGAAPEAGAGAAPAATATATPAPEGTTAPPGTPVVQAPVIVVAAPAGGEVPPTGAAPETGASSEMPPSETPSPEAGMDEELNLDELLESLKKEIENEGKAEDECKLDEDTKLKSSGLGGKTGGSDNKKPAAGASSSSKIEAGADIHHGIPEGEHIVADATDAKRPNEGKNATSTNLSTPKSSGATGPLLKASKPNSKGDIDGTSKLSEELTSAKKTINEQSVAINYLKNELNEINLLNAKLLYTNKLFKEHSVTGEQKLRIVEMFDLSKTIREVKMTFANVAESLSFSGNANKKGTVKSIPASKVQAITEGLNTNSVVAGKQTQIISESGFNVDRFKKLAGINQPKQK